MPNQPALVLVSVVHGAVGSQVIDEVDVTGGVATVGTVVTGLSSIPILGDPAQGPLAEPANFPVRVKADVRNTSADRVFRLKFQKTATDDGGVAKDTNILQNFKLWQSTSEPATGCTVYFSVKETYTEPVGEREDWNHQDFAVIPTESPASQNITIGGEQNPPDARLNDQGDYTDYVYLAFDIESTQTSGGTQTLFVSYDEIQ